MTTLTTTRRAPAPTDADGALVFEPAPRQERQANITIEVGPSGLTIRAEYTGPLRWKNKEQRTKNEEWCLRANTDAGGIFPAGVL